MSSKYSRGMWNLLSSVVFLATLLRAVNSLIPLLIKYINNNYHWFKLTV